MLTDTSWTIARWAAWAQNLDSKESWTDWAKDPQPFSHQLDQSPDVSFLPAMTRRRCKPHTRLALNIAFRCMTQEEFANTPVVFSSRYGDSSLMLSLLGDIAAQSPLSPTQFGLSVHNASVGSLSLLGKSHAPTTAISASCNTLEAGLIEALGQLLSSRNSYEQVLLLHIESHLPDKAYNASDKTHHCFGLGILLRTKPPGFELSLEQSAQAEEGASDLDFLKWLLNIDSSPYLQLAQNSSYRLVAHGGKSFCDLYQEDVLLHV